MTRYIRYLENDEWKYASVKQVGEMLSLKTKNKIDVVSAINELVDSLDAEIVDSGIVKNEIVKITQDAKDQAITMAEQIELLAGLGLTAEEIKARMRAKEEEQAKVNAQLLEQVNQVLTDIVQKADVKYVDGQFFKKVDMDAHMIKYDEMVSDLLKKVDINEYQKEYATIVGQLEKKVDSIDIQGTIDGLNKNIAEQVIEIDQTKTDIIDMDAKINTVKGEIVNTIDGLKKDVTALNVEIEQSKTDFNNKLNADIAEIGKTVASVGSNLTNTQNSLNDTKESLLQTKNELNSVKDNIVYKIEIVSSNGNVFKNGQFITSLSANVYHGSNDVTDTIDASRFKWTRISTDPQGDMAWNTSHAGGTKVMNVTPSDVRVRATFNCELLN